MFHFCFNPVSLILGVSYYKISWNESETVQILVQIVNVKSSKICRGLHSLYFLNSVDDPLIEEALEDFASEEEIVEDKDSDFDVEGIEDSGSDWERTASISQKQKVSFCS